MRGFACNMEARRFTSNPTFLADSICRAPVPLDAGALPHDAALRLGLDRHPGGHRGRRSQRGAQVRHRPERVLGGLNVELVRSFIDVSLISEVRMLAIRCALGCVNGSLWQRGVSSPNLAPTLTPACCGFARPSIIISTHQVTRLSLKPKNFHHCYSPNIIFPKYA